MWIEEELAGKTIIGLRIKSPKVWLEVQGGGWVEVSAEGDCCSEAFIDASRLSKPTTLSGERREITFQSMPTTQEFDEVTAVEFLGDMGSVVVVHRNSSNGYYGNYLSVNSRNEPPADAIDSNNWYRVFHTE